MTNPPQGSDEETQERIAQVRARLSAATPGPWEAVDYNRGDEERDTWLGVIRGAFEILDERFQVGRVKYSALPKAENEANASFIANAPTDVAFLLSRVDSLESALREATQDVRKQFADEGWEIASVKDAAKELEQLSAGWRAEAVKTFSARTDFKRYGQHDLDCPSHPLDSRRLPCQCGFASHGCGYRREHMSHGLDVFLIAVAEIGWWQAGYFRTRCFGAEGRAQTWFDRHRMFGLEVDAYEEDERRRDDRVWEHVKRRIYCQPSPVGLVVHGNNPSLVVREVIIATGGRL